MEARQKSGILQGEMDLTDIRHGYRVADLVLKIVKEMDLGYEDIIHIYTGAIFHDIGKSRVPHEILYKPGRLNRWEKRIMDSHVIIGAKIGAQMKLNEDSLNCILLHHESYDGSGYPEGMKGEEIPFGARLLKICDVYDAIRMNRPYRKAYSKEEALEIMEDERYTFDPKLFNVFKEVIKDEN